MTALRWILVHAMLVAGASCLVQHAVAAEPSIETDATKLIFRRIFVPEAQLKTEAKGLLPIKRDDFDRRLEAARARVSLQDGLRCRIDTAHYSARLSDGQLVDGGGELQVTLQHREAQWLALSASTLAFTNLEWVGAAGSRAAVAGLAASGKSVVLIDRSGALKLGWSAAGVSDGGAGWQFDLQLPASTISSMTLLIPQKWVLTSETGIVRPATAGEAVRTGDPASAGEAEAAWTIDLGGQTAARFRISPAVSASSPSALTLVRETGIYRFTPGNLDAEITLDLDDQSSFQRQASLLVDAPLQVLAVRSGDVRLEWHTVGQPTAADEKRIVVQLPDLPAGRRRTLQVIGVADWGADRRAAPRVRLEGGVWQEGTATLIAGNELQLDTICTPGSRATAVNLSAAANQPDTLQFEYFQESARIEALAAPRAPALRVTSGLSLLVDPAQASATLIADIATTGGERFDFTAIASRRWVIESVETVPADLLEERALTDISQHEQQLRVQLRRPMVEIKPIRLVIRARRQPPPEGESLPADFTRVLDFPQAREHRQLVSLATTDPGLEPKLAVGADAVRLDPANLAASDRTLFDVAPGPLLFEIADPRSPARAAFVRGEPGYAADIHFRCLASPSRLTNEVRIACTPESSQVGLLNLRISPPPKTDLVWSIDGEESAGLTASSETTLAQPSPALAEAIVRLQLQRRRSEPFVVVGRWSEPFSQNVYAAPLFSLPEATTQTGFVEVAASEGASLGLRSYGMSPIPAPPGQADAYSDIRGQFRYEPGRRVELHIEHKSPQQAPPLLWIAREEVESQFSPSGTGSHAATFVLENLGERFLRFHLNPAARIDAALVDGRSATANHVPEVEGDFTIELPPDARRPTVRIEYSAALAELDRWPASRFSAPLPELKLPCLHRRWLVRLAPGLKLWNNADEVPAVSSQNDNSAAKATAAFNFFEPSDWAALWTRVRTASSGGDHASMDAPPGWMSYRLELPEGATASVDVYRPSVVQTLAIAIALAAFAMTTWRRFRQPAWCFAAATAVAAVASIMPTPLAPLCIGAAAGWLAAGLWCLHDPLRSSELRPQPSAPQSTVARGIAITGVLALAWLACDLAAAMAQEPPAKPTPIASWRVVYPINEKQQFVGDYVYLSPDLYDALHRASEPRAQNAEAWIIRDAAYEITFAVDENVAFERTCTLEARYQISSMSDNVRAALPLHRDQLKLSEGGATLDGRPLNLQWDEAGEHLLCELPTGGNHELLLRFAAQLQLRDDTALLEATTPPVPSSRVRVRLPRGRTTCEFPSALGARRPFGDEREQAIELGPANTLAVLARIAPAGAATANTVTVAERLWWQVRPNSVIVDARYEFAAPEGELRRVSLRIDPQLRLLPLGSTAGIARQWIEEAPQPIVHFELAEPYPTEASLHVSLLLAGASGIGNLTLPLVEPIGCRATSSLQALSVAPNWQAESSIAKLPSGDFLQAWGDAAEPPLFVWSALATSRTPTWSVRPIVSRAVGEQQLDCSIDRNLLLARLTATLEQIPVGVFQHRIQAPAGVRARRVVVQDEAATLPIRWWQAASGEIVILLPRAASSRQRIEVEAVSEPPKVGESFAAPLMQLRDVDVRSQRVRLFRHRDVTLQIERLTAFAPTGDDSLLGDYVNGLGRLCGDLTLKGNPAAGLVPAVQLRLADNSPDVAGTLVTVVRSDALNWLAETRCDLAVRQGLLDVLRFEVPAEWTGPFAITPAVENTLVTIPGQTRRQLVIRPPRAVSDRLQLVISSPLAATSSETVRAPEVQLLETPNVASYLALAKRGLNQSVAWETTGLQAANGELSLLAGIPTGDYELFQVAAPRFTATAVSTPSRNEQAHVELADYEVDWQDDGRYFGVARFDVVPAGAQQCIVEMPVDCEIAGLTLDGADADAVRSTDRTWRLRLRPQLSQRVEAWFVAKLPPASRGQQAFAAPQLAELPTDRTLWTIRGPLDRTPLAVVGEGQTVSPFEQDLLRLEKLLAAQAGAALRQSPLLPPSDVQVWNEHQHRRITALVEKLELRLPKEAPLPENIETRYAAALAQFDALRTKNAADVAAASEASTSRATASPTPATSALRVSSAGSLPTAIVAYRGARSAADMPTWLGLLAVAGALFLLTQLARLPEVRDWLQASMPLVLALSAVLIWACLPLGWLAWLAIAAAALVAARNLTLGAPASGASALRV